MTTPKNNYNYVTDLVYLAEIQVEDLHPTIKLHYRWILDKGYASLGQFLDVISRDTIADIYNKLSHPDDIECSKHMRILSVFCLGENCAEIQDLLQLQKCLQNLKNALLLQYYLSNSGYSLNPKTVSIFDDQLKVFKNYTLKDFQFLSQQEVIAIISKEIH